MQYLNPNRMFEINSEIIEWDIKSAGISIIQEYNLLPEAKITKLKKLPKDRMNVSIGKIGQDDKDFAKELENKFNEVVTLFMQNNDLDIDYDVISIKRDAVFTINRQIKNDAIGEFIRFIPKNTYHAYVYIKPYEFFLRRNMLPDIKGLTKDKEIREKILILHQDGMLNLIQELVNLCETTNFDAKRVNQFCAEFVTLYKNKELDFDYYREFGIESRFRYVVATSCMMMDNIDSKVLTNVDISHNYKEIVLPLINLVC